MTQSNNKPETALYLLRLVLLAAAYYVMGRLGLLLAVPPGYATIIWPPSGIALGALLLYGANLWPGVFLGSLVLNAQLSGMFEPGAALATHKALIAIGIASGSTLQALVVRALIVKTVGVPIVLKSWKDVAMLLTLAGPAGCVLAATIGVATMHAFGAVKNEAIVHNWVTWWAGDTFGMLIFLPLMLFSPGNSARIRWRDRDLSTLPATATVALLVPLGLTLYAWKASVHFIYERNDSRFDALAQENEKALLYRIDSYRQALEGAAALFHGSDRVTRDEWRAYVRAIDLHGNYPGMMGMGWVTAVDSRDIAAFTARIRAEGDSQFEIHPAGDYRDNFIITYVEPVDYNRNAIGLNIAFEENRYAAATLARDSGRPAITHTIRLVQSQERGFLLLLPAYHKDMPILTPAQRHAAFRGWIYAPFETRSFMSGLTNSQGQTLDIDVYDGTGARGLIYSSGGHSRPSFTVSKTLEVGQQQWKLIWKSTPAFEAQIASYEPILILTAGLLLTALFGGFLIVITRRAAVVQLLVTERTRQLQASEEALKASEETFRSAMEHASIGMALMDLSGRWLKVNQALCNLLGYSSQELLDKDVHSITHPDDMAADLACMQRTLAGEIHSYQMEKRYFHRDGRVIWALLSVSIVRHAAGAPKYFVVQIQDITQRREMDRMKNEFIATVSHELRTPLTSIRGSLGLIAAGALGALPEKIDSLVKIAHSNSERLVRIINDILDIEKIESGKLELVVQRVPVKAALHQALDEIRAYGDKYHVRFALEPVADDLCVLADPDRFMQVMANLLSNAAKFSPSGAQVRVRAEQRGQGVHFEVEDRGTGIPEEFRSRVFEKFVQVDSSSSRRFEGTGLGLSITRQLIELMGGTINFRATGGGGTTFYFELPVTETEALSDTAIARQMIIAEQTLAEGQCAVLPRVLHVEDDSDLSDVVSAALSGKAEVVSVATLEAARTQLRTASFALMVLDPALPDGSGLSLLDYLEEIGPHENAARPMPVMILSAREMPREVHLRVAATLVKSRMSENHIVETILSLIRDVRRSAAALEN